jgi:cell division protein FtsB
MARASRQPRRAHAAGRAPAARRARTGARAGRGGRIRAAWSGPVGRARLALVGALVVAAVVLFAWFPAGSLLSQRSDLSGTQAELGALHQQDSALAQESKDLSDAGEIGRIAREQYQLVSPGQQAYEVLPAPSGTSAGTPYAGDPGSDGPVTPSAASELPPGGLTSTTTATPAPTSHAHSDGTHPAATTTSSGGFVDRVMQSLEFWK